MKTSDQLTRAGTLPLQSNSSAHLPSSSHDADISGLLDGLGADDFDDFDDGADEAKPAVAHRTPSPEPGMSFPHNTNTLTPRVR